MQFQYRVKNRRVTQPQKLSTTESTTGSSAGSGSRPPTTMKLHLDIKGVDTEPPPPPLPQPVNPVPVSRPSRRSAIYKKRVIVSTPSVASSHSTIIEEPKGDGVIDRAKDTNTTTSTEKRSTSVSKRAKSALSALFPRSFSPSSKRDNKESQENVKQTSQLIEQMNQQITEQNKLHQTRIQQLQQEEEQKLRELRQFTQKQEEMRKQELDILTKQQQDFLTEQRDMWQKEHESKLQMQQQMLEEQWRNSLKEETLKTQTEWMKQQEEKQERLRQQWIEEQAKRDEDRKEIPMDFVKESELEPALEKYITQVLQAQTSAMENGDGSDHNPSVSASDSKFAQMIGPTVEKLVRKVLDIESQLQQDDDSMEPYHHMEDNHDLMLSHEKTYETNEAFESNSSSSYDNSLQNIRKSWIQQHNTRVNPLLNKKERAFTEVPQPDLSGNPDSPSVDMGHIYNDKVEQFFENELRSKLHAHRRWSTFGTGVQKDVITSVYVDTTRKMIIVGGLFKTINMCPVRNIAYFSFERKTWNNMGEGLNNMVTCLTKHKDIVYAGGVFTNAGDSIHLHNIAKYNMQTREWKPLGNHLNSECCTLTVDEANQRLYAGGTFTMSGNLPLSHIGVYNIEKDTWDQLIGGDVNGPCRTLCFDPATRQLYAGGLFTSASNLPHTSYIARYDTDQSKWNPLSQGLQGYCNTIYVHRSSLYAGGTFTCVGNNIAKYDIVKDTWESMQEGLNGICNAVIVNNRGQVYAGGSFTCENDQDEVLNRIAMFHVSQKKWVALENINNTKETQEHHIGLDAVCKGLYIADDQLYMVGSFQKAGNIDAGCIARYKM